MNDMRTVFFVGKPGCGKGTQAELLSKTTGWPAIIGGDQFRAIAAEDTLVGRKVKEEYDAGRLQPQWLAEYLFLKSLFSLPGDTTAIFDGFSRRKPEAEMILNVLTWLGRQTVVIYVKVSDDSARKRIAIRKEIAGRADDSVVDERLKEFYANTEPAIELFRKAGVLIEVDGEPAPETIAENIRTALKI